MTTFDVRNEELTAIDEILFWKGAGNYAEVLHEGASKGEVAIRDQDDVILIQNKQHALDLIKALEKAIELQWLK